VLQLPASTGRDTFPPAIIRLASSQAASSNIMSSNPVFKSGNTALVTGGASGIGLALAMKCAGYGMNVIIVDNNNSNLESAKAAIQGNVTTVDMDVSKIEDFEKLKGKVEKEFGGEC
jgi:NADP-dependent 3-hydroxy acid dehydrogenase YdfG